MGKDSKHQRTKGGVQPSSSSRTAELLNKSGGGALSFMAAAAEAQAEIGGAHPHSLPQTTVLSSLLMEEDLPPEIRMVFRKLQKKDSITKIKALSELTPLLGAAVNSKQNSPAASRDSSLERSSINMGEAELSKIILPHWTKSYQKLIVDDSRKVREQAQIAHEHICKNVGRNLAPFLKHLMPSWYLAQFDLYSPVSSAAKKAFQTVFPVENKRMEVMKFCKTEILKAIVEHLQSSFRGTISPDGPQVHRKEKKKQQGKKKDKEQSVLEQQQETVVEDVTTIRSEAPSSSSAALSESSSCDGEPYALRVSYASLRALNCLIEQGVVENDILEEIFGENGLFWIGAEISKELLIRRSMYDVLTTLTAFLGKANEPVPERSAGLQFEIPAAKCTKFINSALSANQKETLPNLWNTFLMLTLNGVLSDIHLARKQLLTCCKNGFYGNASQIGPSVLPLLARIWEGFNSDLSAKQEFSHDIIAASIQGYGIERSLIEKAAIARTLAESVGFLCQKDVIIMDPVYQFIFANISDLTTDFAKLFGSLVKDEVFYDGLVLYGTENQCLNSKEFGTFIVGICSVQKPNAFSKPGGSKKSVKFQDPDDKEASTSSASKHSFDSLSEQKQSFLHNLLKNCVEHHSYKPVAVLSRSYTNEQLWREINVADIDLSNEDDKLVRLQLSLDLIKIYPENPSILIKFSDEFENFQEPSELKVFLKEVDLFTNLQPVKRWIRMSVFTDVVERQLKEEDLTESELQAILKFVLRDIFSKELNCKILKLISNRMHEDLKFLDNLSHILASCDFQIDISIIYQHYWEMYFLKSVTLGESDLELIETVCYRNRRKIDIDDIGKILDKYLESCEKRKQIEALIDVLRRLEYLMTVWIHPQPKLNIRPEVLSFVGESYSEIDQTRDKTDLVPKFSKVHRSAITKAIFRAKLIQDPELEIDPELHMSYRIESLLDVIYAQSVARIWAEIDKSGYFDKLNQELVDELYVESSRLTEKIFEDKHYWNELWETVTNLSETSTDPIWLSKTPMRVLIDYSTKAELIVWSLETQMSSDDFKAQVDQVLNEFSQTIFKVKEIIPWITEKRVKQPDDFEFECLYRFIKNKAFVHKLLVITVELLERIEENDEISEEFLSLGACWIAAWLKQTKNLKSDSKMQLLWVRNLARGVYIIGKKARNLNQLCPKFVQEYVEFHSSQLYPIIYAIYVQLNQQVPSHNFWTIQTLFYVSSALATTPSATLAFVEPDSVKLCEIFGQIVGDGVSLPSRIAAYRILRKVRYDVSGEGDFPIVPPVIGTVIKQLLEKLNTDPSDSEALVSYLLIWDALLKIQRGSNEFATYVRDQEYLLTPFLNTLFFSEHISLENATAKNFEKEADIHPGLTVNLLHLACTVVQRVLRNLPYTVRWWWNNQVTRQRDRVFVEKFIVRYLSSKLAAEELGSVKLREGVDDNVTIHCHSGCNELIAHYRIEETNVTLTVSLPLNHPLGPVTVKISDKKLHGKISHLLNTRSHSLSAGLKLWKENLDGLYKDVDECAICFFILHNVTKQIPKLACKTCKKKFHAACLYKWFSTSNKSECPLCRNLF